MGVRISLEPSPIAQSVEREAVNLNVTGSIPVGRVSFESPERDSKDALDHSYSMDVPESLVNEIR